ncbi:hypothetical protein A1F94_011987 [Pyrenophora tritici-repentis]|uniref:Uncharacterized protein n=2 Tax=Pyrenophora tritici-repentis TaxID=45151 RepID=A0A2W1D831_9PLEO|nr:hypothetical protein A1F99_002230 [Pyrenophora tritici-repentis]KAG9377584.1 hypothetical protein A1F94_011987 [Pyrenophora tritici-repentis]KAI0579809.1 hypothetical protein Alg215_05554 [Pyrenophora tritici-repentis]KAI0585209.1 hypothetical protein Alg130_04849 [Pyrenophora tritici-repentis]KAI0610932.1 hypothetical protein TUN205_04805 [Pyrenophora tritici-repentis]
MDCAVSLESSGEQKGYHLHRIYPFSGRDINQLKYVCKALYKETVNLELQYNFVEWRIKWSGSTMFHIFGSFLDSCTEIQLAWLQLDREQAINHQSMPEIGTPEAKTKILNIRYFAMKDDNTAIARECLERIRCHHLIDAASLCRRYPFVQLHINFYDFTYVDKDGNPQPEYFLTTAMYISLIFRHIDLTHLLPRHIALSPLFDPQVRENILRYRRSRRWFTPQLAEAAEEDIEAPNMRFYAHS